MQIYIIIKNKNINIKVIFKNIKNKLKIILGSQTYFYFKKYYRTKLFLKNYFLNTILKNTYQI